MTPNLKTGEGAISALESIVKASQKGRSLWRTVEANHPKLLAQISHKLVVPTEESKEDEEDYEKNSIAAYVASILAFREPEKGGLSDDIRVVKKAVASIKEASQSGILTKEEGDAVALFLFSRFIERRFDETLKTVLMPETTEHKARLMWASNLIHGRPAKAY